MIGLIIAGQRADTEKFIVDLYCRGQSIKEIVKTLEEDGREPLKKESVRKIINKYLLEKQSSLKPVYSFRRADSLHGCPL